MNLTPRRPNMPRAKATRVRKQKWGQLTILVSVSGDTVSWSYEDGPGGGSVRVNVDNDEWATVSTDDYEGRAVFPAPLVPIVQRLLRKRG